MTLTASPNASTAVEQAAFAGIADATRDNWLTTSDHRRVARLYIGLVFLFLLAATVVGVLLRAELASEPKSLNLFDDGDAIFGFGRFFAAHATLMVHLALTPLWIGVGTLVVPRQIGSARLAFPRLQSLVLWSYFVGGGLLIASFLIDHGPPRGAGISLVGALDATGGPANEATDLLFASLILLSLSNVLAAGNFVTTVLTQRRPGLSLDEVSPFSWSMLVFGAITLIATPVYIGGLVLVYLDQHWGGGLFTAPGSNRVWVHTVYLFGRPEVLLPLIPALGFISDVIVRRTGRRLVGGPAAHLLIAAAGALTLGQWATRERVLESSILPITPWVNIAIAVPMSLLLLLWLGSLRGGLKPDAGLVFAVAPVVLMLGGLVAEIVALLKDDVQGGSAWTTGHIHTVLFGAPLVAALGAVVHWAGLGWGRKLNQGLVGLAGLAALVGVGLMGLTLYLLGFDGAPARVSELENVKGTWKGLQALSAVGGAVLGGAVLLIILNLLVSVAGGKGALDDDTAALEGAN